MHSVLTTREDELTESRVKMKGRKMTRRSMAKVGYIVAAAASFLFSIFLWFGGSKEQGVFVGLWVPSILSFGTLMLSGGRDE